MKTEAEVWDEALEDVRHHWTCDTLEDPVTKAHCALGALGYAVMGQQFTSGIGSAWGELDVSRHPVTCQMVKKLAACLVDLNPGLMDVVKERFNEVDVTDNTVIIVANDNNEWGQRAIIEAMEKARAL